MSKPKRIEEPKLTELGLPTLKRIVEGKLVFLTDSGKISGVMVSFISVDIWDHAWIWNTKRIQYLKITICHGVARNRLGNTSFLINNQRQCGIYKGSDGGKTTFAKHCWKGSSFALYVEKTLFPIKFSRTRRNITDL